MTRTSKNHGHFLRRLCFVLVSVSGVWHPTRQAVAQPQRVGHPAPSLEAVPDVAAPSADPEAAIQSQGASESEGGGAAGATTNTDAFAQRHWQSGMAYLEEGEYAKALEAFTKAYELSERPSILRSIAVAHEKLGDVQSALAAIDLYLRQVPDAADINDICTYRAELQVRYNREQAALASETEAAPSATAKAAVPSRYVLPREQATAPTVVDEDDTRTIVKWTALGVGVAAGASAVLTGVMAESQFNGLASCEPMCTRDRTHQGRTLAVASTVLTGLALLSGGAALFAWWSDDTDQDNEAPADTSRRASVSRQTTLRSGWSKPQFDASYANSRFMSYANWRF